MSKQQHLLVFRFSALGDVAMTVPVLRLLLQQHPQLRVTMVSTAFVKPLFGGMERLNFHAADLKGTHKGVLGLYRLYREIKSADPVDAIADLHDSLRTKILRVYFSLAPKQTAVIDKGRKEKKELTRRYGKKLRPLKSNFQRYAEVFCRLGYPVTLQPAEGIRKLPPPEDIARLKQNGLTLVGIAPFALHREKIYPEAQMLEVIRWLTQNENIRVYLFGSRQEAVVLERWQQHFPNVESLAGRMDFERELRFISGLDLMVSMDSANMHLASLFGVPVVSIWGGTHPYLGFYGWGQDPDNAVQTDLDCRPSSVFGNKACPGELACMKRISPIAVYEKIIRQLNKKT